MKFTIPIVEKISNNKLRTVHWGTRNSITKKYRDAMTEQVRLHCKKAITEPSWILNKEGNIQIIFTFYFYNRPLDNLNCAGIAKMCEDGLVEAKVIKDDSPKYIESVTLISKVDRENPRIEIELK